jgi:uncharacterized protein YdaU (DUF1376 family)
MFIEENSKPKEKLKAWYLFTDDFIAGTQHLSNEQIGIYIRLLCWNWNKKCSGLPSNNMTIYRIANCITDDERQSCNVIIKEFFIYIDDHYQNERQLQEYLYITRRVEASKLNGKLGGRPAKKPSIEPRVEPSTLPSSNPPTPTPTPKPKPKNEEVSLFNMFWDKVNNKVSKGIAEKNYLKLEEEWLNKPQDLAIMYNKYCSSVEDKQFVKQPAFWLTAKKYLDEKPNTEEISNSEPYFHRLKIFKQAVENKKGSSFAHKYAKQHPYDVQRAINEGSFTKEDAIKYLDMGSWVK